MLKKLKELFFTAGGDEDKNEEEEAADYMTREKVLVFGISFILAFCLWFIVNLSRDFNITIELPLEIGNMPEEMALVSNPPSSASVGITGEGWKLISLYNNPPSIVLDIEEENVDLFQKVQQQVSILSEVNITKVEPLNLNLSLEEKVFREVPVEVQVEINTHDRFGIVGEPVSFPDTVTISGASSSIEGIESVRTEVVELEEVKEGREIELEIEKPDSITSVIPEKITYRFDVTEFTEGEVRIPIRIRNLPPGRAVTYNPTTIVVRYGVPVGQYGEVQNTQPFRAYVDYSTIEEDTTGLVMPQVERVDDGYNVTLRGFQPRRVSYFRVVED